MKFRLKPLPPIRLALAACLGLALLVGLGSGPATSADQPPAKAKAGSACAGCHDDLAKSLPDKHAPVKAESIAACLECHPKEPRPDKAGPNAFSARLHLAHAAKDVQAECATCHAVAADGSFQIPAKPQPLAWGKPKPAEMELTQKMFASWAGSTYLDQAHGQAQVLCLACHGPQMPVSGDSAETERCLGCHGPLEKLAAKTAPAQHPDRNPHASHLVDVDCSVCHKAHEPSAVYCLQCHPKFEMSIRHDK